MGDRIGFLPWGSTYWAFWPDTPDEKHLKVATLYYDRLILPVSQYELEGAISRMDLDGGEIKKLGRVWRSMDEFAGNTDPQLLRLEFTRPRPGEAWGEDGDFRYGLKGAIDQELAESHQVSAHRVRRWKKEDRRGYLREANAVAVTAVGSAHVWMHLRRHVSCEMAAFRDIELRAAARVIAGAPRSKATGFSHAVEAYVPSVRNLPWAAVTALREHPRVELFRRWLAGHSSQDGAPDSREVVDDLWEVVGDFGFDLKAEVVQGFLANLPIPFFPINPVGAVATAAQLSRKQKVDRKWSWLLFLHSLKRASD